MWKRLAEIDTELLHPGGKALTEWLLGQGGSGRLLDLGCGPGVSARLAWEQGYEVYGVDQEEEFLRMAQEHCPEGNYVQADFKKLPFADVFFDAVLCECVLSLAPAPDEVLREIRRVLRPGGVLLWSDLYRTGVWQQSRLRTEADWKTRFRQSGFTALSFRQCEEEWRTYVARLLWEQEDCSWLCGCVDVPLRLAGYCCGAVRRKEDETGGTDGLDRGN